MGFHKSDQGLGCSNRSSLVNEVVLARKIIVPMLLRFVAVLFVLAVQPVELCSLCFGQTVPEGVDLVGGQLVEPIEIPVDVLESGKNDQGGFPAFLASGEDPGQNRIDGLHEQVGEDRAPDGVESSHYWLTEVLYYNRTGFELFLLSSVVALWVKSIVVLGVAAIAKEDVKTCKSDYFKMGDEIRDCLINHHYTRSEMDTLIIQYVRDHPECADETNPHRTKEQRQLATVAAAARHKTLDWYVKRSRPNKYYHPSA